MRILSLIFIFLLTGCYMAKGSPSESEYWVKNGEKISYNEKKTCSNKIKLYLGERFDFLWKESQKDYTEFIKNKSLYNEYLFYLDKESALLSKCYYDLGYRFNAPIYWCLAQDGDNTKICVENMKYRK